MILRRRLRPRPLRHGRLQRLPRRPARGPRVLRGRDGGRARAPARGARDRLGVVPHHVVCFLADLLELHVDRFRVRLASGRRVGDIGAERDLARVGELCPGLAPRANREPRLAGPGGFSKSLRTRLVFSSRSSPRPGTLTVSVAVPLLLFFFTLPKRKWFEGVSGSTASAYGPLLPVRGLRMKSSSIPVPSRLARAIVLPGTTRNPSRGGGHLLPARVRRPGGMVRDEVPVDACAVEVGAGDRGAKIAPFPCITILTE